MRNVISASFVRRLNATAFIAFFAVALVMVLTQGDTRLPFASSELSFYEVSPLGAFHIVPASCSSSPHYAGECDTYCPSGTVLVGLTCIPTSCPQGQSWNGSACVCPSGQTWDGTQCIAYSCPAGYVWNGTQCACNGSCDSDTPACPSGQSWNGSQCVCASGYEWTGSSCIAISCPLDYSWNGSQCVCLSGSCAAISCPAGQTWNGIRCLSTPQCTARFICAGDDHTGDGIGDDRTWQSEQCTPSSSTRCEWGCVNGVCLPAPTGLLDIRVIPWLVRHGEPTGVTWEARQVSSCTVTEDNPGINDEWTGAAAGCGGSRCQGTDSTSGIEQRTQYTLRCVGLDGKVYTDVATVNILPVFKEL